MNFVSNTYGSAARRCGLWLSGGFMSLLYGTSLSYKQLRLSQDDSLSSRWSHEVREPLITVVIVSYRQPVQLKILLLSLACQTLQNFDVIVLHDGPDAATSAAVDSLRSEHLSRIRYYESSDRFNDYGHSLRDIGITMAAGEYILITNGDNYYSPRLMEFVTEAIERENWDIVMWDMVHSHPGAGGRNLGAYAPFGTLPLPRRMDMGCFVVKTKLAKQVGFADKGFAGDATYLMDVIEAQPRTRVGKIPRTLLMHN